MPATAWGNDEKLHGAGLVLFQAFIAAVCVLLGHANTRSCSSTRLTNNCVACVGMAVCGTCVVMYGPHTMAMLRLQRRLALVCGISCHGFRAAGCVQVCNVLSSGRCINIQCCGWLTGGKMLAGSAAMA
jgi:hypothetical protein